MRLLRRLIGTLLIGAGLLVYIVMFTPLVPWWARKLAGPWNDPSGDVLIVLAGSGLEEGVLGESSYLRAVYAVRAYQQAPYAKVIVSGGGPTHPASAMRDLLVCRGIPADRVMVENAATSTHENALFVKNLLGNTQGRKVLLTSDYHMYRAERAFLKAGVTTLPHPFPDAIKRSSSYTERWPIFFELASELVKSAYYYTRGWI
ncbi:MAG TPA: YdcF family protein [Bryobacteraceae bacterium]|nr:YdcF family protein [Bryobacteraceae bacterium]